MTAYYLLDHRNPNGDHFYTSRKKPVKAIVMHVTAGLQDQDYQGDDLSAEKTARYAATTDRAVSWHSASDSDTNFKLLPASYTAFQCQGYNSSTYGHEISKRDVSWADEPKRWVEDTLRQTADCLRPIVAELKIPLRHASRAQVDAAIAHNTAPAGFTDHALLDPQRRSDPGKDFPWADFFALIEGGATTKPSTGPVAGSGPIPFPTQHNHTTATISRHSSKTAECKDLQGHLNAWRKNRDLSTHDVNGVFDEWTHIALTTFQKWYGLNPDGICGPGTWNKIHTITKGAKA